MTHKIWMFQCMHLQNKHMDMITIKIFSECDVHVGQSHGDQGRMQDIVKGGSFYCACEVKENYSSTTPTLC